MQEGRMTPVPKISTAAPYRWVSSVLLDPKDVDELLNALPQESNLVDRLRATSRAADNLAERLNEIEHGGKAA
jgi:hypothetical protein